MGGAYVAKPDAASTLDVPTGWGDWTFPGPWPPGYTPVLTFGVSGAGSLIPGNNYNSTWTLYDHETYKTDTPTDTITWTATIDSAAVQLKFSGDAEFASSLTSAFEDVGDSFYGDAPTILFNVTAEDVGSTIVLQATSEAFDGYTVTKTKDILLVSTMELTFVLTQTLTFNAEDEMNCVVGTRIAADDGASATEYGLAWMQRYYVSPFTAPTYNYWNYTNESAGGVSITNPFGSAHISKLDIATAVDDTYRISLGGPFYLPEEGGVGALELKVYLGEDLLETYTKNVDIPRTYPDGFVYDWLSINGATGAVTLLDSLSTGDEWEDWL